MKFPFSISVIIPAFNETENLPNFLEECTQTLSSLTDQFEIIVVDDCSTDTTQSVLLNLQDTYPNLRIIRNERNIGCHPSTLVGLKAACNEVLIFLPADNQIPSGNIPRFLSKINDYDLVCSYRRQRIDNFFRRFASQLYNMLLCFCFGIDLHDTHSAIAVKQEVVKAIASEIQSPSAFAGCEFILRSLMKGFRVTEIEIDHLPRIHGKAKGANMRDAIRTPLNLMQLFWEVKRKNDRGVITT